MKILLRLIIALLVFSCSNTKTNEEKLEEKFNVTPEVASAEVLIEDDSVVVVNVSNGINFFDYSLRRWNGITWEEYASTGHPDTAVALHMYQILTSNEEPDFLDYATYTNLYENTTAVKSIIQEKFSDENPVDLILLGIDSINTNFMQYAVEQVDKDLKQYGQSDGPYYSFVEKYKK